MTETMDAVKIVWNEGDDTRLTVVESDEAVLQNFFEIDGWDAVHEMSKCAALHRDFYYQDWGFDFKTQKGSSVVELYTSEGSHTLQEQTFLSLMLYLFELLIAGANDNHHTIRYEPWWHAFTNYMFALQEQLGCNH